MGRPLTASGTVMMKGGSPAGVRIASWRMRRSSSANQLPDVAPTA